jgi:hypothetical protein
MSLLSRDRLVDELLEADVAWRETCAGVNDAYSYWASKTGPRGRVAFGLYTAALDAEEQAAESYATLVRRTEKLLWAKDSPAEALGGRVWGDGWP